MESVFIFKNKGKKKKHNAVCRTIGIFLAAATAFNILLPPPDGLTVYALDGKTKLYNSPTDTAERKNVATPLDFSSEASNPGNLDSDGYQWNNASKTLKLKNVNINSKVTLPDATVTIETEGTCSIKELSAGSSPNNAQITFLGSGELSELTITERIDISGGHNNSLTVAKGAHVTAQNGIAIGADGGVDSILSIYGTLTAKSNGLPAIYGGKVVIDNGGQLNVSGESGVSLNGMSLNGPPRDFTDVFTVRTGGCFTADCSEFNVRINSEAGSSFSDGNHADQAVNVPEGYLPEDCEVKRIDEEGVIKFIKKSTGLEYTGPLTIHDNHDWSDNWEKDETGHWKKCKFTGCDKISEYSVHSYDNNTWACTVCGARLNVTLNGAEGLVYNGQEQKPSVTVSVDVSAGGTELDASKYELSYNNNINSGKASVTVTGKDGLIFERTEEFLIVKATPVVTWGSTIQNVTYCASQAAVTPPSVTLVNGENFDGEIHYSYTTDGSGSDTAGLPTNAGTYTVKAHIAEQSNYTAADSTNTLTLTIDQAENAPNMPSDSMNVAKKNEKVSDVELPEGWQWQEPDKDTALEIGVPVPATAVYTGADKDNYKNVTAIVVITRSNCDHENTELRNVAASTCQQKGYSGDTYCLDCGELLTKGTQTDLADHSGGTATCISGKICTVCGTEYTAKDSNVHMHTEIRGQKNAACSSDGYTGDTFCTDCGTKIRSGKTIPATGHKWQVTNEKKPTYTENGVITYTCSLCGDTYTKPVDKLVNTASKPNSNSTKTAPANQVKRSPQTGEY